MSYRFTRPVSGKVFHTEWFVEVGFLVYSLETWLRAWRVLAMFPFRLWWFDVLPWQCIAGTELAPAVIDEQWVVHTDAGGKTLKINTTQVLREKHMRNNVVEKFGCCSALRSLPKESPKRDMQKCQCSRGTGLYC